MFDYNVTIKIPCVPAPNEETAKELAKLIVASEPIDFDPEITISVEKVGEWVD